MYNRWAKIVAYIGAGAGVIIFAGYGLLPGSFLGGTVGLALSGMVFGFPLVPGLLTKIIVAAFMALGAALSALVIVCLSAVSGWMIGYGLGWLCELRAAPAEAVRIKVKK